MDVRFHNPGALFWLWGVVAAAVLVVIAFRMRRRALHRFASPALIGRIAPGASGTSRIVRAILILGTLVAMVAAMTDPRWGVTYRQVRQRGIDLVVLLDISRSMLAEDVKPNRLVRAKTLARDLLDRLGGDRVALVTFAGTATVRCPLTVDHGAFLVALETAGVESGERGGSLVGDGLRAAAEAFTDEVRDHKAIVVFSDGEDHGSYPLEAAQRIEGERGIPVYTIGLGDAGEGARIPVEVDGRRVYLKHEGEEVRSKLDGALLREVALATGGAWVPVGTGTVDMGAVYEEHIEPVAKRDFETGPRRVHQPRYQWSAGLALALLTVESFLAGERRRRLR